MHNRFLIPASSVAALIVVAVNVCAQRPVLKLPDLAWTRNYAIPDGSAQSDSKAPIQRQLSQEPRLMPVLRIAFPQRQWIWKDHGSFWSLPEVARAFLASVNAGHSAWLDEDRYVSEEGCVPHDCFDRGLLWIDTDSAAPVMIFALTQIAPAPQGDGSHMWIFLSLKRFTYPLPAAFQHSAKRWYDASQAQGYKENVLLATVVTTDGEQHDISFEDVIGKTAGAAQ